MANGYGGMDFGDSYDPSFGLDLSYLRRKQQYGQLNTPGLMDQPNNPFGGLFQPPPMGALQQIGQPPDSIKPEPQQENSMDEFVRMMRQLYHPETTATDRFNTLLDKFPQREKPSLGRAFVAAGMGLGKGGFKDAQTVLNEPNERRLADWKEQAGPEYNAANLERQANANERQILGQGVSYDIANRKNLAAEKKYRDEIRSRETIAEGKNKIAQDRNEILRFKVEHPDWEMDAKGPRIIAFNPQTHEKIDLGDSGNLSDIDKINLGQKNRLEQIAATGAQARETEGVRQPNRLDIVVAQGDEARKTKETPVAKGEEKPLDVSRDRTNNLNEAYDRHPEWREWLNRRGTTIAIGKRPEASSMFNPLGASAETTAAKQAEYDRMMDFIYGTTTRQSTNGTQKNQSNDTQKKPPSMMSRFGIPSPNAVSPETAKSQPQVPQRPPSIPPGAQAQYNTGTGKWRYWDTDHWTEVK